MKKELCALFPACAVIDGKLLCITDVEHIFEKIDINDGKVECIDDPKGYTPYKWSGTDMILPTKEIIYMLEQNGEKVLKYSPLNNECHFFDIKCNDHFCSNFVGAVIYGDQMYIFPRYRDGVLKLNLNSGSIKNIERFERLCPDVDYKFCQEEKIPHSLFACSCQVETHMWVFTETDKVVIDYDITKEQFTRYMLPERIKSCVRAEYSDDLFYILTIEGEIYSWSPESGAEKKIYDFGQEKRYPYFGTIIITGKRLWTLPLFGNDIYVIDLEKNNCEVYSDYPTDFGYFAFDDWGKYFSYCSDEEYYYFAMHSANYILSINKRNGQERWIKPKEADEHREYFFDLRIKQFIYGEDIIYDVYDLIEILKKDFRVRRDVDENGLGGMIWDSVKGKIV